MLPQSKPLVRRMTVVSAVMTQVSNRALDGTWPQVQVAGLLQSHAAVEVQVATVAQVAAPASTAGRHRRTPRASLLITPTSAPRRALSVVGAAVASDRVVRLLRPSIPCRSSGRRIGSGNRMI